MAETHLNPVIDYLRHLIGSVQTTAMSDGELLERFLTSRDEAAVQGLIRRYGPLVLGVCRRVLHNAHAAEDVFQATFLVLMRKAPTLNRGKPLGGWLYTVAYRLALRARANEARRRHCEAQAARSRAGTESHAGSSSDQVVALEEELQKLPEKYRAPLVLCYLEGKTNEQAAEALGCPRGSMSARLAQSRERLRACLSRRGYAVPSAGIATALATAASKAAVPLPLLANTVRAALWFASEDAGTASFVSSQAVALAKAAFRAMFLKQLEIAAAVLLATGMLGTGATMLLKAATQTSPRAQVVDPLPPEARPDRAEIPGERLPSGAIARMGTTQLRHGDAVFFAAYTPDGQKLVTAGRDKMVRLWDLATGNQIRRFEWGEVELDSQPKPAEDSIAQRREQQFWDDTARSCQAALSVDGKIVAASWGGVVCLWETASGKNLRQLRTGQTRLVQLGFSADGKSLLTVGPAGYATAVWEVATGRCIRRTEDKLPPMHFGAPGLIEAQNAVVSPGLKYLATCKRTNFGIPWLHITDLATGKELPQIKASAGTLALTFSADDKTLIWDCFSESAAIVISDVATGKELRRLESEGRNGPAMAIAHSPNGKSLAVCRLSHTIELWDLTTGKLTLPVGKVTDPQLEQQSTDWVSQMMRPALAFSPDSRKLVCSLGGATIRQFQADTGAEIPGPGVGHRAPVSTLALSADGKSLRTYSAGDPARSWDWLTGKEKGQLEVPASATHMLFTADGRFGFAAGYHFTFCSADGKKVWKIAAENSPLVALALSSDGALLATRNFLHPEVHLWDATTRKERYTLGPASDGSNISGPVTETTGVLPPDLVFSPDGRYLAGAGPSRQLCLWDVTTGALLWEVAPRAGQTIERFAFSPSGRSLASVNVDGTVTLYEAVSGAKRGQLGEAKAKKHRLYLTDGSRSLLDSVQLLRDAPVCLAFSPDGRYLATAQYTPEIHLWDVIAGREVGQFKGHGAGSVSLLFVPDGKYLISSGSDTTVLTWDLTRLTRAERRSLDPAAELPPQTLDLLWSQLASPDATRAFDALCKLSASPDQSVLLVKERVGPATPADSKRMVRLLADLESDRFEVRRQAEFELQGMGELAQAALRQTLEGDPALDFRQRVERLLDKVSGPEGVAGQLGKVRAVELLELIGSSDARRVLEALAGGAPGARLTREAKRAIERLTKLAVTPKP
jgi:RNA polymerase sigma factor (sigma-70 family)